MRLVPGKDGGSSSVLTKGDVADVVADGGVRVLQLQGRLPVAEQNLRSRVAGPPTLFELLKNVTG